MGTLSLAGSLTFEDWPAQPTPFVVCSPAGDCMGYGFDMDGSGGIDSAEDVFSPVDPDLSLIHI